MINLFYIILLGILISSKELIRKSLLNNISSVNLVIYNYILVTFFIIIYILYNKQYNQIDYNKIYDINIGDYKFLSLLIVLALIQIFTSLIGYNLLKNNNLNLYAPFLSGIIIIFIILGGFYFFKEEITIIKLIGIILIVIGIIIINMYNY